MQTNYVKKEVLLKIIYYGSPASGKKSNFQYISQQTGSEMSAQDVDGQPVYTLEYLPKTLQIAGMKLRCLLHAISCEVEDKEVLREYFQGVDGVVVVVDSKSNAEKDNIRAVGILEKILKENGQTIDGIPLVFQWNKQDLPGVKTPQEWGAILNDMGAPAQAARAHQGDGVLRTLDLIINAVCTKVEGQMRTPSARMPKKRLEAIISKKKEEEKPEESEEDTASRKVSLGKKWKAKKEAAEKEEHEAMEKAEQKAAEKVEPETKPALSEEESEDKPDKAVPKKLGLGKKWKAKKDVSDKAEVGEIEKKPALPKLGPPAKEQLEEEEEDEIASSLLKKKIAADKKDEEELPKAEKKPEPEDEEELLPKAEKKPEPEDEEELLPKIEKKPEPEEEEELPLQAEKKPEPEEEEEPKESGLVKIKTPPLSELESIKPRPKLDLKLALDKTRPEQQPTAAKDDREETAVERTPVEIIETLKRGEPLENLDLKVLDLSGGVFEKPVRIIKCRIQKLVAEGCDFKSPVSIEHTTIGETLSCSGKIASLFREEVRLKKVSIAGSANFDNCIFTKGLSIEDSQVSDMWKMEHAVCEEKFNVANSKITNLVCQNGQFRGKTGISGSQFENAGFQKTSFYGPVSISAANFHRVHFMDAYCKNHIELARCIFEKSANLGRIQCDEGISLEGCVCNGYFNLGEAYLKERSRFRRTEFCNDASFTKLLAAGPTTWEKVSFASLADFSGAHFAQIDMLQNLFYGVCNFQEAVFTGNLSLLECVFEQKAHLGRALFLEKVDLRLSQWKNKISLANTTGDYIFINREQIEGRLLSEAEKDYEIAEQEYWTLKSIFERQKQFHDSDWAHYRARRAGRKKVRFSIFHPLRTLHKILEWFFLDLGCKYGMRPWGLLVLSALFIALFAGVYGSQFAAELQLSQQPEWQKWTEATWRSAIAFIPGGITWEKVSVIVPFSRVSMLHITMVVENLLGFFLLLLFALTFTRKLLQH